MQGCLEDAQETHGRPRNLVPPSQQQMQQLQLAALQMHAIFNANILDNTVVVNCPASCGVGSWLRVM